MHPKCFENQEQYDAWLSADNDAYHYKGGVRHTPICTDCTPSYATAMRIAGRCEHPEVKFCRSGKAYKGIVSGNGKPGLAPKIDSDLKWEPISEQEQPNAAVPCAHA